MTASIAEASGLPDVHINKFKKNSNLAHPSINKQVPTSLHKYLRLSASSSRSLMENLLFTGTSNTCCLICE